MEKNQDAQQNVPAEVDLLQRKNVQITRRIASWNQSMWLTTVIGLKLYSLAPVSYEFK